LTFETLEAVRSGQAVALPEILTCELPSQRKCELEVRNTWLVGKKAKHELSREGLRFHWLLNQLYQSGKGMPQEEMCRRTGLSKSYLSTWINITKDANAGRTGFGAEIVRRVKDGFQTSPDYFFDEYDGEVDHRLYSLEERRTENRMARVEKQQAETASQLERILAMLAQKDVLIHEQESELKLLRHKLEVAERRTVGRRRTSA